MIKYRVMVPESVVEAGFRRRTDAHARIEALTGPESAYAGVALFVEEYEED